MLVRSVVVSMGLVASLSVAVGCSSSTDAGDGGEGAPGGGGDESPCKLTPGTYAIENAADPSNPESCYGTQDFTTELDEDFLAQEGISCTVTEDRETCTFTSICESPAGSKTTTVTTRDSAVAYSGTWTSIDPETGGVECKYTTKGTKQ